VVPPSQQPASPRWWISAVTGCSTVQRCCIGGNHAKEGINRLPWLYKCKQRPPGGRKHYDTYFTCELNAMQLAGRQRGCRFKHNHSTQHAADSCVIQLRQCIICSLNYSLRSTTLAVEAPHLAHCIRCQQMPVETPPLTQKRFAFSLKMFEKQNISHHEAGRATRGSLSSYSLACV
jgi:hypothetical protein